MLKIAAMGERIDHEFSHLVRRQLVTVVAICALEVAPHVDLGKNVVQARVNQFRNRPREFAPVEKHRLIVAFEQPAFQADLESGVAGEKRVCV